MQYTGLFRARTDVKDVETVVMTVPGVTKFVQVFPGRDSGARLDRMFVIDADKDVLEELSKLSVLESVELVKPRFTCGKKSNAQD